MGKIEVANDVYWGAQTQRSLQNFKIGGPAARMPIEIIRGFAILKKNAAKVNMSYGILPADVGARIVAVCDEILAGKWDEHFPLVIFQTGSGTQTNMNVNEVREARGARRGRGASRRGETLGPGPLVTPAARASPPLSR